MARKIRNFLRKGNFRVIDTFFDPKKEVFVPENDGDDYKKLLIY